MEIFISWSGTRSRHIAQALKGWLPMVINAVRPWLSSADIDKGARWGTEVASKLQSSKFGIICLTPSNIHADWILFEAGALSKTLENTRTCTLLIGVDHADIEFPLAQFQHTQISKSEILKLVTTINKHLDAGSLTDEHLKTAFEKWWPELEAPLASLPSEGTEPSTRRTDRQLLEEMLELLRSENRSTAATSRIRSRSEEHTSEL